MALQWQAPQHNPSEPIYLYDNPANHIIKLKGMFIKQHGFKIRCISLSVQDLDRISRTPTIGDRNNKEMANLFVQSRIPWQRSLDEKRVPNIETWWKTSKSISPNNSVLFFPELTVSDIDDEEVFYGKLNPDSWCFDVCPNCQWKPSETYGPDFNDWYADCCAECGHLERPAIVVDGQHRIRGMSSNPDHNNNHHEKVFSTWLCQIDNFSEKVVAKIFTEITSAAVPLDTLHKEFLMAKFQLAPDYNPHTSKGRYRRKAYEIAADLNNSSTAWARVTPPGRVDMIERKAQKSRCDIIDIRRLTNYLFKWLSQGAVPNNYLNSDIVFSLENFLTALISVYPNHYWNNNRSTLGALQYKGIFRLMLDVYELTTLRLQKAGFSFPASVQSYQTEINYIKNIQWDSPFVSAFTSSDPQLNFFRRILRCLYENAPPVIGSQKVPIAINNWFVPLPDTIQFTMCSADFHKDEILIKFESKFLHSHLKSITLGWPLNALSTASALIKKGNVIVGDDDWKLHGVFKRKISSLTGTVNVGDILDCTLVFKGLTGGVTSCTTTVKVK
tara:strand:+ start:588 stop:2258 length:1671 start_codon:yes stop_codon:yes gene_type:complete